MTSTLFPTDEDTPECALSTALADAMSPPTSLLVREGTSMARGLGSTSTKNITNSVLKVRTFFHPPVHYGAVGTVTSSETNCLSCREYSSTSVHTLALRSAYGLFVEPKISLYAHAQICIANGGVSVAQGLCETAWVSQARSVMSSNRAGGRSIGTCSSGTYNVAGSGCGAMIRTDQSRS